MLDPGPALRVVTHLNEDVSSSRGFLHTDVLAFLYERKVQARASFARSRALAATIACIPKGSTAAKGSTCRFALSVLATFIVLQLNGSSINSMVLGGLALALSRLIDNSVVVLENIYRHLERGEPPLVAAESGGKDVALLVLASTLTMAIVFFTVTPLARALVGGLVLSVALIIFLVPAGFFLVYRNRQTA